MMSLKSLAAAIIDGGYSADTAFQTADVVFNSSRETDEFGAMFDSIESEEYEAFEYGFRIA